MFAYRLWQLHLLQKHKRAIYPGFPESFENPGELIPGYKKNTLKLATGNWFLFGSRVDSTANDHPTSGKFALRFVGNNTTNALAEMKFDLKDGASKVIVWYSAYGAKADKPCTFQLEYSSDAGKNWSKAGQEVTASSKSKQSIAFELSLAGNVRFRINKLGLGVTDDTINNGRLSIDDISVYKN